MTLQGALNTLENIRARAETAEITGDNILALEVIDLLLDYVNNKQLRDKVEEIPL